MNFKQVATEIADVVEKKSKAYGDSFGKSGAILKILYPNGVKLEEYDNFLAITRIVDKLFRIATDKDAFGEDPWRDIVGYGLNAAAREEKKPEKEPPQLFKVFVTHPVGNRGWISRITSDGGFNYANGLEDRAIKMTAADVKILQSKYPDCNFVAAPVSQ